jgi:hypothetical protein
LLLAGGDGGGISVKPRLLGQRLSLPDRFDPSPFMGSVSVGALRVSIRQAIEARLSVFGVAGAPALRHLNEAQRDKFSDGRRNHTAVQPIFHKMLMRDGQ